VEDFFEIMLKSWGGSSLVWGGSFPCAPPLGLIPEWAEYPTKVRDCMHGRKTGLESLVASTTVDTIRKE
jgi:hypothetical protein